MSYDRKPWSKARPYCRDAGYEASLKCRLGGWIVVYDRHAEGCEIAGTERWVVMHQPSTRYLCRPSEAKARALMKAAAEARSALDCEVAVGFLVSERSAS